MDKTLRVVSSVHQPHDKIVKKLLSNPDTARDILSLYLPEEIKSVANLHNLELQRDTFIDDEHRAYAVDLLYKTTFQNDEGYIWLLLEHQRKSDHWMPVRLFKYIAIIWDHLRKTSKSRSIPLIYPLVIYNGSEPYKHSLTLSDLIEPAVSKEIFSTLFTQPFCLIDLATIPDDTLARSVQERLKGIVLLMALKHVHDRNLQIFMDQVLLNALQQLDQAGDTDEVVDVLYYLLNESEFLDEDHFWSEFHHNFSKEVESKMTTIAQKIEARGREKGLEEGIEKEKVHTARRLLTARSGLSGAELITWVHRMTGLSMDKIVELQKKH